MKNHLRYIEQVDFGFRCNNFCKMINNVSCNEATKARWSIAAFICTNWCWRWQVLAGISSSWTTRIWRKSLKDHHNYRRTSSLSAFAYLYTVHASLIAYLIITNFNQPKLFFNFDFNQLANVTKLYEKVVTLKLN